MRTRPMRRAQQREREARRSSPSRTKAVLHSFRAKGPQARRGPCRSDPLIVAAEARFGRAPIAAALFCALGQYCAQPEDPPRPFGCAQDELQLSHLGRQDCTFKQHRGSSNAWPDEVELSSRCGRSWRAGSMEHIEMTNICERGAVRRPGTVDDMLVSTSFSLWLRRTHETGRSRSISPIHDLPPAKRVEY